MTLIEALLMLPEHGESKVVSREVAEALAGSSIKIVQRCGILWSLTDGGRRFLVQFRRGRSDFATRVVVRLSAFRSILTFDRCGARGRRMLTGCIYGAKEGACPAYCW